MIFQSIIQICPQFIIYVFENIRIECITFYTLLSLPDYKNDARHDGIFVNAYPRIK